MESNIRMLLVDDQILFVENLRFVIENSTDDLEIVGVALDGEQALQMIDDYVPDVVLLDVRMPTIGGVEVVERVRARYPSIRMLMLSTFDDDQYVQQALSKGAAGYILKDILPSHLIEAVHGVMSGQVIVSPDIAARLVRPQERDAPLSVGNSNMPSKSPDWLHELTRREREVLSLMVHGYDNRQIANKMCVAEQTIRNHVSDIYAKIGIKNRLQIMRLLGQDELEELLG